MNRYPRIALSRRTSRALFFGALVIGLVVGGAAIGAAVSADDEIPGIVLPASPVAGRLVGAPAEQWDLEDIYSVPLAYNDKLEMTLQMDSAADFDLYLLSPSTTSLGQFLDGDIAPSAASVTETSGATEHFTFVSTRSSVATYFVNVSWWTGTGDYTLTWKKTALPQLSIDSTVSGPVRYAGVASILGTATVGGLPASGAKLTLYAKPSGASSWTRLGNAFANGYGAFAFSAKPTKLTEYRIKSGWGETATGVDFGYSAGPVFTATPEAALAITSAPKSIAAKKKFTVSGTLKPSHAKSKGHVTITASRVSQGVVVQKLTFKAAGSGTGFSASCVLPTKGSWRLVASVPADTAHAATSSVVRTLTVK
jgi:hypothetical protein